MAEKKFLDLLGLQKYDEKLKAFMADADAGMLAEAKKYAEDLSDNYDAAGTAASKMEELANGAVAENKAAIDKLNGDASTDGSVAKAIADAKALIDADIDAIQEDIGNVDNLQTTNKELVAALNEVRNSVSAGGVASAITIDSSTTTDGALKSYTIKQGENVVGTIDIPKDMVVQSGEVVDVDGIKNIKLVLQNVAEPLYIPVGSLVDIYVAKAGAAQIQIAIDPATREVSAQIVAGSVTATELAANAVVTEKIADKNVTKAKLSAEVQASLDKADVAESNAKAYTDEKDGAMDVRMKAVEAQLGTGEGTVDAKIAAAKQEAIDAAAADATSKANTAEGNAKTHATNLNNAMDLRMQAVEGKAHEHGNKNELDKIADGDVAKWNAAQANAEATAAAALSAAKTELEGKISDGDKTNKDLIDGHADRIEALEAKVGDGFVEISDAEIDAMFAAE